MNDDDGAKPKGSLPSLFRLAFVFYLFLF